MIFCEIFFYSSLNVTPSNYHISFDALINKFHLKISDINKSHFSKIQICISTGCPSTEGTFLYIRIP